MATLPRQPQYREGADARLIDIIEKAAAATGMRAELQSGLRPGDRRQHGQGNALDIQLYDSAGNKLPNYQDGRNFGEYERFAQAARAIQVRDHPELSGKFRWGGYFGQQSNPFKYGAFDLMHFDLAGDRLGMAGGSWEGGLAPHLRKAYDVQVASQGMGALANSPKAVETFASGNPVPPAMVGGPRPMDVPASVAAARMAGAPLPGMSPTASAYVGQNDAGVALRGIASRPPSMTVAQRNALAAVSPPPGTLNVNNQPLLRRAQLATGPNAGYAPPLPSNTLNINSLPFSRSPSRGVASRGPITAAMPAPAPRVIPPNLVQDTVASLPSSLRPAIRSNPGTAQDRQLASAAYGSKPTNDPRTVADIYDAVGIPPRSVTPMTPSLATQQARAPKPPTFDPIQSMIGNAVVPSSVPPRTFAPPKPTVNVPLPPGAGYASLPTPSFGAKPAAPAPVMPMPPISRGPTPVMPMPPIARPGVVPMPASARPASSIAPMPMPASARPVAAPVLSGKAGLKPTVGGVMYGASNADKDKEKKDSGVGKGASGGAATPAAKAAPYGTKAIGADGKIKTKTVNSKGVAVWK